MNLEGVPALILIVLGVIALLAARFFHWILIVAGVILLAVGVYLVFGAQLFGG